MLKLTQDQLVHTNPAGHDWSTQDLPRRSHNVMLPSIIKLRWASAMQIWSNCDHIWRHVAMSCSCFAFVEMQDKTSNYFELLETFICFHQNLHSCPSQPYSLYLSRSALKYITAKLLQVQVIIPVPAVGLETISKAYTAG